MDNEKIGGFLRSVVIREHLRTNLYPPISPVFVAAAIEALNRARDQDWEREIELPNGRYLSARDIISGLHLEGFLETGEEGDL